MGKNYCKYEKVNDFLNINFLDIRVFDKRNKKMYPNDYETIKSIEFNIDFFISNLDNPHSNLISIKNLIIVNTIKLTDKYTFETKKLDGKDLIVLKYTGCKDSKYKKIYEGDIVEFDRVYVKCYKKNSFNKKIEKVKEYKDKKTFKGVIGFKNGCFVIYLIDFINEVFAPLYKWENGKLMIEEKGIFKNEFYVYENLRIVGNVFENYDLIPKHSDFFKFFFNK